MEKDDYSFYHSDKIVELRYSRIFAYFRREFFKVYFVGEEFLFEENVATKKFSLK